MTKSECAGCPNFVYKNKYSQMECIYIWEYKQSEKRCHAETKKEYILNNV
jgi:hypothetical protein